MKHIKIGVITLLLFGMVIAMTGIVCADQPVPAVPETQTLSMTTTADVVGLAMETDAGAWTLTNSGNILDILTSPGGSIFGFPSSLYPGSPGEQQLIAGGGSVIFAEGGPEDFYIVQIDIPESMLAIPIAGASSHTWQWIKTSLLLNNYSLKTTSGGIHTGSLDPGQIQYTTAYDANIVAQAGHTVFTKSMNIDTRNKVISQSNLNAKTALTFAATADGGNVVGSENLMIDGAGNHTTASDRMLCPFSAYPVDIIPAYCNIVQAGSKYDLTIGSVTTNANDRFISSDATNPVVLNYDISVKPYSTPQGQALASGSAMAYMKAHIQEARNDNAVNVTAVMGEFYGSISGTPLKSEDLIYNEQSSAQGTITAFNKVMAYQSGKSLL